MNEIVRPSGIPGDIYRPDMCEHDSNDGCEWCCQTCNYAWHRCPGCGTVIDHREAACGDCVEIRG